ncbi:sensor domain-containing protein [Aromatoleum bremense]|uniref:sensor domain-containing protein n=1 Tax=Aromatoleum bremense TaxID=76115 RepID=UPI00145D1B89|nr:EAL domain-containing protein [Aromatoleum bremense]QTQ31230.1 Diguanylate cyclase/phosphodiesterase, PAS domain-containing [Aromatoleum bremense]
MDDPLSDGHAPSPEWLPPGGETGNLVRRIDWGRTTLGPVAQWPASLKTAVALVLGAGFPAALLWGEDLVQIYNDGYRALLGARHPDALGRPARDSGTGAWQVHEPLCRQVRADGEAVMLSEQVVESSSDGTLPLYVTNCYSPVRCEDGSIGGVLVTVIDDTPQILARRRQEASEARYRALFESIDEGVCIIEMIFDGQGKAVDYRFIEVNPAFEQHTGLVDVVGRRMRELVPEHEAHWYQIYGEVALTGEPIRFQRRAGMLDRWFDVYAFRYGKPDERQVAIVFSNITDEVRTEAALFAGHVRFRRLSEGLERLSRADSSAELLDQLLRAAQELAGADGITVELDNGSFRCIGRGATNGPVWERSHHPLVASVTEWAIRRRETAVIVDVRDDDRVPPAVLEGVSKRSLVMVPVGGAIPTGAVGAYWLELHRPDDEEVAVLEVLARAAGTALARQLASERLRQSEERFRVLVEETAQAVWEGDAAGALVVHSPSWSAYTGQTFEEMAGFGWLDAVHPDDRPRVEVEWRAAVAGRCVFDTELRLHHRRREWRWANVRAAPLVGVDGEVEKWVGMNIDITDRKQAEQRAHEAALHDPLTALPNRRLIFEYAEHLLAAAGRKHSQGAFLFIDLNRFKPVNDRYGHEAGDRLLQEVACRLKAGVRKEDIVGRLGGDEFIVLLPYLEQTQEAMNIAQYVVESVSQPFVIRDAEVSVSPSIGISLFPQHGMTVDALIRAADLAMYQAKHCSGGAYCVYAPDLEHRDDVSTTMEGRLKQALARNTFTLHYQPVIDLRTGAIRGAEALLRFGAEDCEALGPGLFIPVAESSGLIGAVGEWVTAEACRQHVAWAAAGLEPVPIAINVSPIQFRQRRFAQRLADILRECGMNPASLQLEITESAVMDNADDAAEILAAVRALGVKVVLDGFGTGCSSLVHLGSLPLDKLKIDRSFVQGITQDSTSRAVVEAVIALGRTLGLEVVAEGIESGDTLAYLKTHGCDQAQGYFLGRPLPRDEFARQFLSKGSQS